MTRDPRLDTNPDFILLKRYNYSLKKLLERHPNGVPNEVIEQALGLTSDEVAECYESIVKKLRRVIM